MSYLEEFARMIVVFRDEKKQVENVSEEFELTTESEMKWNEILRPYGLNSFGMVTTLNKLFRYSGRGVPWAIIAFPADYRLAGHVLSVRESKDDFLCGSYEQNAGRTPSAAYVPPVSQIILYRKAALEKAASRSPLLSSAWALLQDMPETMNWFCIPDPPDEAWMAAALEGDDDLFRKYIQR